MELSFSNDSPLLQLFKEVSSRKLKFGDYFNMEVLCKRFEPILAHHLGIVEPIVEEEQETKWVDFYIKLFESQSRKNNKEIGSR